MKKNNGFAISSIIYALLILFLALVLLILANLASRKAMFDKEKRDILSRFDGDKQTVCRPSTTLSSPSAIIVTSDDNKFAIGAQYDCELGDGVPRIFYVLEETSTKVSLIMNQNLGDPVAWISKEDYVAAGGLENEYNLGQTNKGPITVTKTLAERTTSWNKLKPSQIKLPTGKQIAKAGNLDDWTLTNISSKALSKSWLFENLNEDNLAGYWTSTADINLSYAWYVRYNGRLAKTYPIINDSIGVRPVIELSKSSFDDLSPVTNQTLCNAVTTATTGNVPTGNYKQWDEYTCELGDGIQNSFMILKTNGDNVSLLMTKNLEQTSNVEYSVEWISKEDYLAAGGTEDEWNASPCEEKYLKKLEKGPITAEKALREATKNWSKLQSNQIKLPDTSVNYYGSGNVSFGFPGWWLSTSQDKLSSVRISLGHVITNFPWSDEAGMSVGEYIMNIYAKRGIRPVIKLTKNEISTLCNPKSTTSITTGNVPNGNYDVDDEYTCNLGDAESSKNLTFFVVEKDDSYVSLIINKSIGTSKWITKEDYIDAGGTESGWNQYGKNCGNFDKGPVTLEKKMVQLTSSWNKLSQDQITIPTYSQLDPKALITKPKAWATSDPQRYPNLFDFWTRSSASAQGYKNYTLEGGAVTIGGNGTTSVHEVDDKFGIRPVITISKSQLK